MRYGDLKFWEKLALVAALVLVALGTFTPAFAANAAFSGDPSEKTGLYISAAKLIPGKNSTPTGAASVGYRAGKLDLMVTYVAESNLYYNEVRVPAFVMGSISRVWTYKERSWLLGAAPTWEMGVTLKGADRCAYNGEMNCNRRLPLPYAFHFGIGLQWKDIRIDIYHDSNNAMDSGPERKNIGLNTMALTVRF